LDKSSVSHVVAYKKTGYNGRRRAIVRGVMVRVVSEN